MKFPAANRTILPVPSTLTPPSRTTLPVAVRMSTVPPPTLLIPFEPTVIVAALRSDNPPLPTLASIMPMVLAALSNVAPDADVMETDGRLTAPVAVTKPVPAVIIIPYVCAGEVEIVPPNETLAPDAPATVVSSTRSPARVSALLKTIAPP